MLKEMRKKKGMSQAELARRAGINQGVISYIEAGRTKHPRVDTMQKIAKALGCTVDKLIKEGKDGKIVQRQGHHGAVRNLSPDSGQADEKNGSA